MRFTVVWMESFWPPRIHVVALLLASIAALFARAWLQLRLVDTGYDRALANDLSYLVVPPIVLLLALPVLAKDRLFVRYLFRRECLTPSLVVRVIALGCLVRIAWHAHVVAGVATGAYRLQSAPLVDDLHIGYLCPPVTRMALSVLVFSVLVPIIEELTHRAYVQTRMHDRGPVVAVTASTLVFVLFHLPSSWGFVFLAGIVLGITFWATRSMWAVVILHAVVNFLPEITLRCVQIDWNPDPAGLPLWETAATAGAVSISAALAVIGLLAGIVKRRGSTSPDADAVTARRQHAR